MENADIARVLTDVADLLEIQGANPFRIRAYRNAVHTILDETTPLRARVAAGEKLTALPGIGKDLAGSIAELVTTGKLAQLDELAKEFPLTLIELTRLPGLGPKKARKLWEDLGVTNVAELETAVRAGKLLTLSGFGAKSATRILESIASRARVSARLPLGKADRLLEPLLGYVRSAPGLARLEVAGSYRRRQETIGDVDLVAVSDQPQATIDHFAAYSGFASVIAKGDTKCSALLHGGLQVDLRVVSEKSFGAALVYFTGSKEHNVKLRQLGVGKGLRISEYGVFKDDSRRTKRTKAAAEGDGVVVEEPEEPKDPWAGEWLAGREEKDVYQAVGLRFVPPELRENRGEIELLAAGKRLPRLLELGDVKGDLQMHSTWSDGADTLEEMMVACAARGYEYLAVTDHSQALAMVRGLDAYRLGLQWQEIAAVQARHPEIRILKSMEIDILADGTLDLEEEMLAGLDLVVVSVHSRFELPRAEQTARILRAIRHPRVGVLAHPTGRRINRRKPIDFDIELVLAEAARLAVAVEANASPERLDLKDTHLALARDLGCKIVVSTDAHRPRELDNMRFGVDQARRAGLTRGDVLNTLPLDELLAAIRR